MCWITEAKSGNCTDITISTSTTWDCAVHHTPQFRLLLHPDMQRVIFHRLLVTYLKSRELCQIGAVRGCGFSLTLRYRLKAPLRSAHRSPFCSYLTVRSGLEPIDKAGGRPAPSYLPLFISGALSSALLSLAEPRGGGAGGATESPFARSSSVPPGKEIY